MNRSEDVHKYAQAYVDSVLEKQRQMGYEAHLSEEAYAAAVERAAQGFAGLTDRTERPHDRAPDDVVPA